MRKCNERIYLCSYEARLENCVKQLGMTQEEARRMIASVDKARNAYHRKYAGYLPSDTSHKHLLLDSSLLGVDETRGAGRGCKETILLTA